MSDLIRLEDVLAIIDKRTVKGKLQVAREVLKLPTIEPQRKKGHWIRHPEQRNIFNGKTIECSECHEKYTVQYVEDELFCRHCGADMREDGEADEAEQS